MQPMSCGVRALAAVPAVLIVCLLTAQEAKEPGAKDLYMHPRQLPYRAPDQDKSGAASDPTKSKSGGTHKGGGKSGVTTKTTAPALGIRYWILKRDAGGRMVEVPPGAEFHNGDAIQVKVETNYPGYLYILNRAASGEWSAMFPSEEFQGGDNRVDGVHSYTMPPRAMIFEEPKGVETLTVLFARKPEPDFEKVIRARRREGTTTAIADDIVRRKQQMYSRDLRIEKAPPPAAGEAKDNATYAVNPTGNPDARVFVEIPLVHN